jgi:hypothetical protein
MINKHQFPKTILMIVFGLSLIFCSNNATAQVIHAFVFCKTGDSEIGKSCDMNFDKVLRFCNDVADAMNRPCVEHKVRSYGFYYKKVDSILRNTVIGPQDIVIVYLNTHGTKTKWDKNIFPLIDIPSSLIESYSIYNYLLKKNPQSLMTIVESCSGYSKLSPQNTFIRMQGQAADTTKKDSSSMEKQIVNIRKLFDKPQYLMICAGQPGKSTWATDMGSTFTNCLMEAFQRTINLASTSANVSWNFFLNQTKEMTYSRTLVTSLQYYPVWEIRDPAGNGHKTIVNAKPKLTTKLLLKVDLAPRYESIRHFSNDKYYYVNLKISNTLGVRKVVYYLGRTMKDSVVTLPGTTENLVRQFSYKMPAIHNQFQIRASLLLNDGSLNDIYAEIKFPGKDKITRTLMAH